MTQQLPDVARLFGRVLLYELDAAALAALREDSTREALSRLSIEVPAAATEEALAAEYFECFLHPRHGAPPVASLWLDGDYGSACRRDIERWAELCGYSFAPQDEQVAAPDHLGALLLLWAELAPELPEKADELAEHLSRWAPRALHSACARSGFYGDVSRALRAFLELITTIPSGSPDRDGPPDPKELTR